MKTDERPASADQVDRPVRPPFPKGCVIRNIRRGDGARASYVYASLYGPDGELMISATLEYINMQIVEAGTAAQPE